MNHVEGPLVNRFDLVFLTAPALVNPPGEFIDQACRFALGIGRANREPLQPPQKLLRRKGGMLLRSTPPGEAVPLLDAFKRIEFSIHTSFLAGLQFLLAHGIGHHHNPLEVLWISLRASRW